jgi:hypothetical protein
MAKAMGSFRDSLAPSWLSSPRADVPADPPSHMPCIIYLNEERTGLCRIVITILYK